MFSHVFARCRSTFAGVCGSGGLMVDNLIDDLADIFLGQVNIIKLIGPTIRHGDHVDLIEVLIDPAGEFFYVPDPDAGKHLPGHFAEESLDKIQP